MVFANSLCYDFNIMNGLMTTIIGGVIVAIIVAIFNIGGTKHVSVHGLPVRKTGKWIIIISILMILGGLAWAGKNPSSPQGGFDLSNSGVIVAMYGLIMLVVGKVVAWFQKP